MANKKHLRLMKQVKRLSAPKKPKGYGDYTEFSGILLIDDSVRYIAHLKIHKKD